MTGLEAIPKIAELIASLLKKAGDKETMALANQIQTYQKIIEGESKEKDAEIAKMKKVIEELEAKIKEIDSKLQHRNMETFTPFAIDSPQRRDD